MNLWPWLRIILSSSPPEQYLFVFNRDTSLGADCTACAEMATPKPSVLVAGRGELDDEDQAERCLERRIPRRHQWARLSFPSHAPNERA
jgi:hypothetical protein